MGRMPWNPTEALHLGGAVLGLGVAFAVAINDEPFPERILPSVRMVLVSLLAVATGFVPHELAHKVAAQRFGMWAEFRGHWPSLGLSLLLAIGTGVLFAAPGAVLIRGRVDARRNGIISLVGPAMNLIVAAIAWPFAISLNPETDTSAQVWRYIAYVNALLCVFNLLPVGPLDGRKVWWWNRGIYILALAVAVAFFVTLFVRLGPPQPL